MFGPSSSPYKVSHSGTESAVVLQCLMLLAAFLTPFGRDFSDFFSPLGVDKCWTIVSFSSSCTDVSNLLKVLIPGSSLLDRSSL